MLWGALAQSVPDIDFVASFWMPTAENLLAHRGFTHSLLFAALIIPVLAMSADRIHRPHNISFRRWLYFFAAEVLLHLFLDAFNNYGIGWFEPFSSARYSFNTIYVADPFFSIWPGTALVVLLIMNRYNPRRRFWWRFGMIVPLIYLGYCVINKLNMDREIRSMVDRQNIPRQKYFTTPAPLQNWLWYVVAGDDKGYYIGFRSVFDSKKEMEFEYFPRNDSLLKPIADHEDLQQLIRFSQGFYTVEKWNDTLVFNDLRFGQIVGWENKRGRFVFHYYLQHPEDNELVVQRGRFAGWNRQTFFSMLRRIKGN